jgi:hypothetical protein
MLPTTAGDVPFFFHFYCEEKNEKGLEPSNLEWRDMTGKFSYSDRKPAWARCALPTLPLATSATFSPQRNF